MSKINRVGVIGAGVMGASIAAHVTNAGHDVLLLDIVADDDQPRSAIAQNAVAKLLKTDPEPLSHKRNAKRITTGNIEDDFEKLSECDWIVEAVIERLDIKQDLYAKIDKVRKADAVVSSNTSTFPLEHLTAKMSPEMRQHFLITHFFNPPRYMRLLELVASAETLPECLERVSYFADHKLGKSLVSCHDRPGFIANRLGIYWIATAIQEAIAQGLTVEEADAIMGRPCGIPKTGVFALVDLVGLDLMPYVVGSLVESLPKDDPMVTEYTPIPLVEKLIANGYTGRKGKGGFYRLNRDNGGKIKEGIDLHTGEFRVSEKASLESAKLRPKQLRDLVTHTDKGGTYAWKVLAKTLSYALNLVGDAAETITAVDEAMCLGYNWKLGPFELLDILGADWFAEKLKADGMNIPALLNTAQGKQFYREQDNKKQYLTLSGDYQDFVRPTGVIMLEDIKRGQEPVIKNVAASLWDIGDGVACLEFTSKMNSLDADSLTMVGKAVRVVKKDFKALVIYNEGSNFSAGANLGFALFACNIAAWPEILNMVETGQEVYKALKYAPFPVVGAPSGMALGGGCEILLHCDAVQAHIETYVGLVECGVGLVPAWGGCKELISRWAHKSDAPKGSMAAVAKAFEIISMATVAKSAHQAKSHLFMREHDRITMNHYRLLADAKAYALELVDGYQPPEEDEFRLPGKSAKVAFEMAVDGFHRMGKATDYDRVVADELATVLSGADVDADVTQPLSEDDVLELERDAFMRLTHQEGTMARVEHMLLKGKPLRN